MIELNTGNVFEAHLGVELLPLVLLFLADFLHFLEALHLLLLLLLQVLLLVAAPLPAGNEQPDRVNTGTNPIHRGVHSFATSPLTTEIHSSAT